MKQRNFSQKILGLLMFLNFNALALAGSWHDVDDGDFNELAKLISPTIEHLRQAQIDVLNFFDAKNIGRRAIAKHVYQLISANQELSSRLKELDFEGDYNWSSITTFATDTNLLQVRKLLEEYHYFSAELFVGFWNEKEIAIDTNKVELIKDAVFVVGQLVASLKLGWHEYCRRVVNFTLQFDVPTDRIMKILQEDQKASGIFQPSFRVRQSKESTSSMSLLTDKIINDQFIALTKEMNSAHQDCQDSTHHSIKQYALSKVNVLNEKHHPSQEQEYSLDNYYGALYFLALPAYLEAKDTLSGLSFGTIIASLWAQSASNRSNERDSRERVIKILNEFFRKHNRPSNDFFGFDGPQYFRRLIVLAFSA